MKKLSENVNKKTLLFYSHEITRPRNSTLISLGSTFYDLFELIHTTDCMSFEDVERNDLFVGRSLGIIGFSVPFSMAVCKTCQIPEDKKWDPSVYWVDLINN